MGSIIGVAICGGVRNRRIAAIAAKNGSTSVSKEFITTRDGKNGGRNFILVESHFGAATTTQK
jgi:hypothetical protein